MRRHLRFILLCLLAVLVLWWFGRGLDWMGVRQAIGQADWRLIALGVLLVCISYFVRALRWRALLAPLGKASLRELFAATTVGFGAIFLVGRTGEVLRPAFLSLREPRVRPAAAFVTIAVERLYDMSAVIFLFALNLLTFRAPGGDPAAYARVRQAGVVLVVAMIVGIAMLIWFRHNAPTLLNWLERKLAHAPSFIKRIGKLLASLLAQVAQALGVLTDARGLAVTVSWTILLWCLIVVTNWLVLRAFGLPFGLDETLFVLGWALVGSLVPTPGGAAGAFHAATAAGLIFLGVPRADAAAVAIILHLVVFGPAVFFGLYYFLTGDVSLGRIKGLTHPAADERGAGEQAGEKFPALTEKQVSTL
ncbi:MAG: flippase-like domain-containing protein [Acidobacteriota bacterium]|nr:flippase-like domain-containing protein [Acidobacteriota bacterium]